MARWMLNIEGRQRTIAIYFYNGEKKENGDNIGNMPNMYRFYMQYFDKGQVRWKIH